MERAVCPPPVLTSAVAPVTPSTAAQMCGRNWCGASTRAGGLRPGGCLQASNRTGRNPGEKLCSGWAPGYLWRYGARVGTWPVSCCGPGMYPAPGVDTGSWADSRFQIPVCLPRPQVWRVEMVTVSGWAQLPATCVLPAAQGSRAGCWLWCSVDPLLGCRGSLRRCSVWCLEVADALLWPT